MYVRMYIYIYIYIYTYTCIRHTVAPALQGDPARCVATFVKVLHITNTINAVQTNPTKTNNNKHDKNKHAKQ